MVQCIFWLSRHLQISKVGDYGEAPCHIVFLQLSFLSLSARDGYDSQIFTRQFLLTWINIFWNGRDYSGNSCTILQVSCLPLRHQCPAILMSRATGHQEFSLDYKIIKRNIFLKKISTVTFELVWQNVPCYYCSRLLKSTCRCDYVICSVDNLKIDLV